MGSRPVECQYGNEALSRVDQVHATIREAILSGEYPPASRLLVATVADERGLSSVPVREGRTVALVERAYGVAGAAAATAGDG